MCYPDMSWSISTGLLPCTSFPICSSILFDYSRCHEWQISFAWATTEPVRFVNNCWIFPSDRARVSNGETNRVIGVTVYSHRRFEKEKIHIGKYKIDAGFLFTSFNHNRFLSQTLQSIKKSLSCNNYYFTTY